MRPHSSLLGVDGGGDIVHKFTHVVELVGVVVVLAVDES